ncbi:hypothetical protein [Pseudobacteriovorax antillogorgiicola]|uniref:Uncharacterized protein n=1 Tax=Pseudobacteriovorax antillogorgiicola TaxID=1513793 RepID=A0A1Y6BHF1_9BACT|nr:hypothetical protein [Pseudobacteriovorax antillogorgiicola]TCS55486.1 hypothetical protein EDD56_105208 [Pseudobacteriovorax antillogorgiicola]SMF11858.1 hypothetical protein SAMN06296036_105116 [Pseudobacteriovorax antillogorgiicola]
MKALLLATGVTSVLLASCGSPQVSEPKINIDVPKDAISYDYASSLTDALDGLLVQGKTQFTLDDLIATLPLPDGVSPEDIEPYLEKRNQELEIECQGRKCKLSNDGEAFEVKVDSATILIGKTIEASIKLSEDNKELEICRISGVRARVGVTQNVDGGILKLGNGSIDTFKIDVGIFGSYPSRSCDF